jgi:hypothetical protein
MSRRNERRRRARMEAMGFLDLLSKLTPRDRRTVNEKVIWAVNELTDLDGRGPAGTKAIIADRARQLIIDTEKIGFTKASKRFRDAISGRRRASKSSPELDHENGQSDGDPTPDIAPRHFVAKNPLVSMPQSTVLADLEPDHSTSQRA